MQAAPPIACGTDVQAYNNPKRYAVELKPVKTLNNAVSPSPKGSSQRAPYRSHTAPAANFENPYVSE